MKKRKMLQKHTTLLLIPGGSEIALPQNNFAFKTALTQAVENRSLKIIMLADDPLIDDVDLHKLSPFKNVLLIESDTIVSEDDAIAEVYKMLQDNYLPTVATSGFDFQVVKMEPVGVVYEDFEILEYR